MIKKAINRWAFKSGLGIEECLRLAKKHGFDGLELNLEEHGDFSLDSSPEDLRQVRKLAERAGVDICSLCSLLFWKYPITSSDPKVRDKGIEVVRLMIDSAAELGVKLILVVPGMVHADPPLDFGNPPIRYSEAWQRALSITKELARHAESKGVTIGLENVYYNKFLITQMEYRRFLDEVHSDQVKLYLDLGNTMLCGFPEDWIEYLADYVCQLHVKDFDKNINTLYGWKNIFQGHISWDKVASALQRIGYQGYLVGEPALSPFFHQQEELIKTTSSALDRLREMVQAK